MFFILVSLNCADDKEDNLVTPIPPTPKTVMYKVTGTTPSTDKVSLSYYDKAGNHYTGIEVKLPWSMSWTILPGYSKVIQISASWSDYDNPNEYTIVSKILKDGAVLDSESATGKHHIHACATESVKY